MSAPEAAAEDRPPTCPNCVRLQAQLQTLQERVAALEATNNRAERMLRPAVITRKTGGCNRSRTGARAHEVMASVLVTLRQQGRDVLGYMAAALLTPGLPPRLLAAPAPSSP